MRTVWLLGDLAFIRQLRPMLYLFYHEDLLVLATWLLFANVGQFCYDEDHLVLSRYIVIIQIPKNK